MNTILAVYVQLTSQLINFFKSVAILLSKIVITSFVREPPSTSRKAFPSKLPIAICKQIAITNQTVISRKLSLMRRKDFHLHSNCHSTKNCHPHPNLISPCKFSPPPKLPFQPRIAIPRQIAIHDSSISAISIPTHRKI